MQIALQGRKLENKKWIAENESISFKHIVQNFHFWKKLTLKIIKGEPVVQGSMGPANFKWRVTWNYTYSTFKSFSMCVKILFFNVNM